MTSGEPGTVSRCGECGAPLAADQTYCIVCGARSRPLPARVAVALADIEDHGHAMAPDDPVLSDDDSEEEPDDIVSAARGGVIALLAVLAVGVVIGGLTSAGGLSGLANTIVLAFNPGVQPAAQVVAPNPGGGGGGGGGGGRGGGGGGAAPSGGGGGGAGATATTPAPVTVTVSNSQSTAPGGGGHGGSTTPHLPPIGHVWLIVLSQQGYSQSWEDARANPYLNTLRRQGELIVDYDAVATSPLANEVALLSGQGPTNGTIANCPTYAAISPAETGKDQQVRGDGCIYPDSTQSLPQQIANDGLQWKAYIQGISGTGSCATGSTSSSSTSTTPGSTGPASTSTSTSSGSGSTTSTTSTGVGCPQTSTTASSSIASTTTNPSPSASTTATGTAPMDSTTTTSSSSGPGGADAPVDTIGEATCPHPALNALSLNQSVSPDGNYVNWKNPIIYFQSLLDPAGGCSSDDVGLPQLAKDLKDPVATPAFSYVAPDPCSDGSDTPCRPGAKAGLGQAEAFLRQVVPEIEASEDYKQNGLILITFDEAQQSGPEWDTSSCCGQPVFPNLPAATGSESSTTTTSSSSSSTGTSTQTVTSTETVPSVGSGTATGSTTTSGTTTNGCETTTSGSGSTTSASAPTGTTAAGTTPVGTTPPDTAPSSTAPTTPGSATQSTSTTTGTCTPAIAGNPPGGGQVGLLMISPYVKPNKVDTIDTLNHFSLLKSIEALFKLPSIGYARTTLEDFQPQMFETTKH